MNPTEDNNITDRGRSSAGPESGLTTRVLHYTNPYLSTFAAVVTHINTKTVVLDQTAFYVAGGGQPGDHGTIDNFNVAGLTVIDGIVHHELEDVAGGIEVGQTVHGAIDWQRRYAHMRNHTAQHLAFVAVRDIYGINDTRSGAISTEKARFDVAHRDDIDPPILAADIEAAVNDLIASDHEIKRYPDPDHQDRWVWAIARSNSVPCGGTHLRTTGEVGNTIVRVNRKGSKAIRITVQTTDQSNAQEETS